MSWMWRSSGSFLCARAVSYADTPSASAYRPLGDTASGRLAIPLEYAGGFGIMQNEWSHPTCVTSPDYLNQMDSTPKE